MRGVGLQIHSVNDAGFFWLLGNVGFNVVILCFSGVVPVVMLVLYFMVRTGCRLPQASKGAVAKSVAPSGPHRWL